MMRELLLAGLLVSAQHTLAFAQGPPPTSEPTQRDSLWNGSAIGAAIGGGGALAAMAKACRNTNCSDTSANLDPRLTLAATLVGAGIGALIDAALEGREAASTAAQPRGVRPAAARTSSGPGRFSPMIFGRFGWARFTDDEGSLGDGMTVGVGAVVPITARIGLQIAYDRHDHTRTFESPGPGVEAAGGFSGTEQLVTAKALFYFRGAARVRPYAGLGMGVLYSDRMSEFPTYFSQQPNGVPVRGPSEILTYDTRGAGLGVSGGLDARVTERLSILGDLTLDLSGRDALGSTRLTCGAGWRF